MYPSKGLHGAAICDSGMPKVARMYRGRIALCLSALILLLTHLLLSVAEAGFSVGGPLS